MHGARLVEILENVCGTDYECNALMEDAEEHLEEWWELRDDDSVDWTEAGLQQRMCVTKLELCCPSGHYGKKCKPCPGGADNVCSGNGACIGDGLRSGTGKCSCVGGFTGKACDACTSVYASNQTERENEKERA